jgi:hypothetical protein
MSQATDLVFSIPLDDGRTISATPVAGEFAEMPALEGRQATLRPTDSDSDTSGHAAAIDVAVDVEGHAMVLRMPTTADAAALRKALAVGVVTATILAAGAVAATQQHPASSTTSVDQPSVEQPIPAPGAPTWKVKVE